MYAKKVVEERLKRVGKLLGFEPTYHSVAQVIRTNKHFFDLLDPETGQTKRKLKSDEIRWIQNERALCQADFSYWATRYAFIRDWQDRLIRFEPTIAQRMFLDICAELEEMERAIALIVLKARQLGLSTVTELCAGHRVQFYPNVNAIVSSSDPEKSALMAKMMELCWDHTPWWLMPIKTKHKAGELMEFGRQNSAVSIQHGTQFSGIARGSSPTVAHLSEVCDYRNPSALIDASLLRAMHESPWMFLVLESTAMGRHNWWHDTWENAKEGWKDGTARLRPIFLPWFVGRDIYPTETWIKARPVPSKWQPRQLTEAHAKRAESYVRSNDILRKHLGTNWRMPVEQMWYWEVQRAEYEKKKILPQFYSEMPADDLEAFQSTNISVFPIEVITSYRENCREPVGIYSVITPDVPERLRPPRREIDRSKPPIQINAPLKTGDKFHADLLPMKFSGFSAYDPHGKLILWELPEPGEEYGIGVDTSDGVGKDRTVMEIVRKGNIERNDAQVGEWASPFVNSYDLPTIAFSVGCLFTTLLGHERIQPKMVIECNRNGDATQLELRKMGWTRFHNWIRYDNKKMRSSQSNKLGWFTNAWTRPMMMDLIVKSLRDEWVDVNSPYFVDEMADLEAREDIQALKAAYGGHDDRIMAFGMILFSLHALELKGTQRNLMRERAEHKNTVPVYPSYQPPAQAQELDEYDLQGQGSILYTPEDDDTIVADISFGDQNG